METPKQDEIQEDTISMEEKLEELSEDDAIEREHDKEVETDERAVDKDMERLEQDFGNAGNY